MTFDTVNTNWPISVAMSTVLALLITKAIVSGWWRVPAVWIIGIPAIGMILYQVIWPSVFSLLFGIIMVIAIAMLTRQQ